jgi:hypothetical protein
MNKLIWRGFVSPSVSLVNISWLDQPMGFQEGNESHPRKPRCAEQRME